MTDFDYDCYLKKSIAHSAMKRKCGSKSKKCGLPSDRISQKQWNERCGEIVSYQLGLPVTWKEFCRFPKDIKEEYLNNLINKYSANARNMADMFDVSVATVFRIVKKENLNVKFQKGRHPTGSEAEQFEKFLSGLNVVDDDTCQVEEAVVQEPETGADIPDIDEMESSTHQTRLDAFTMSFSGRVDVNMIANSLRYVLGQCNSAKILISCEIESP